LLMGRITSWEAAGYVLEHLRNRLARDGDAIAVQQARLQQDLHDLRDTAGAVQVHRQVFARRLEVAQHRRPLAHALEVVDGPFHAGRVSDGQEVQYCVGGATGRHDHGHCVLDGLARHDVTRLDVLLDRLDQHLGRVLGRVHLLVVRIGHGGRVGQGDAQRFE
jgi:hypothetical protein